MEPIILHSDMNNFYASVEILYDPTLKDKPVAVAGNEETRHGIVLAKNDLAKRFGVHTGQVLWEARGNARSWSAFPLTMSGIFISLLLRGIFISAIPTR